MGFSVSGATAVIFVGVLVSAAVLYPAVDRYTERRSETMTAHHENILTQQNTAIETTSTTYNTNTNRLEIAIQNAGSSTLAVSKTDLLIDGEYVGLATTNTTVANDSTTDIWAPGETLTITMTEPVPPNRIKIITGPGIAVTESVEVI